MLIVGWITQLVQLGVEVGASAPGCYTVKCSVVNMSVLEAFKFSKC